MGLEWVDLEQKERHYLYWELYMNINCHPHLYSVIFLQCRNDIISLDGLYWAHSGQAIYFCLFACTTGNWKINVETIHYIPDVFLVFEFRVFGNCMGQITKWPDSIASEMFILSLKAHAYGSYQRDRETEREREGNISYISHFTYRLSELDKENTSVSRIG